MPHKANHLGMSVLAIDDNLFLVLWVGIIISLDAFLDMQNHRTCGVNNLYVLTFSLAVGRWWFAMSTQQEFGVVEFR